jgi:hypothetical protein
MVGLRDWIDQKPAAARMSVVGVIPLLLGKKIVKVKRLDGSAEPPRPAFS